MGDSDTTKGIIFKTLSYFERINNETMSRLKEAAQEAAKLQEEETIKFVSSIHAAREITASRKRYEDAIIEIAEKMREPEPSRLRPEVNIAEAVAIAGTSSQADTKPTPLKQANNDVKFSGLLNIPQKIDDWFEVIDNMTTAFYSESNAKPTKAQAWVNLWASPPEGYKITTGIDRGGLLFKNAWKQ